MAVPADYTRYVNQPCIYMGKVGKTVKYGWKRHHRRFAQPAIFPILTIPRAGGRWIGWQKSLKSAAKNNFTAKCERGKADGLSAAYVRSCTLTGRVADIAETARLVESRCGAVAIGRA